MNTENQITEAIKLLISVLALGFSLVGLVSLVIFFFSTRASVCNQIYSRWQTLLLAQNEETEKYLVETKYDKDTPHNKAHFIAITYLNLYEEAYFYHKSKILFFFPLLPETLWKSIQRSMTTQLTNLTYLRTMWDKRKESFSDDFVKEMKKISSDKQLKESAESDT